MVSVGRILNDLHLTYQTDSKSVWLKVVFLHLKNIRLYIVISFIHYSVFIIN